MNEPQRRITSILVSIDIDEVEKDRDNLLDNHFTPEERTELAPRHIRSTAGRLALKRAILGHLADHPHFAEKDIVLTGTPRCPPQLISAIRPSGRLFLSISHSKSTAHGLAVLQE
jgi:hypothetical protein